MKRAGRTEYEGAEALGQGNTPPRRARKKAEAVIIRRRLSRNKSSVKNAASGQFELGG